MDTFGSRLGGASGGLSLKASFCAKFPSAVFSTAHCSNSVVIVRVNKPFVMSQMVSRAYMLSSPQPEDPVEQDFIFSRSLKLSSFIALQTEQ